MTDKLTEQIAERLYEEDAETIGKWENASQLDKESWRSKAESWLRFLSSLGLVQLDEDQSAPAGVFYPWVTRKGFRRVHSILPQEKGK